MIILDFGITGFGIIFDPTSSIARSLSGGGAGGGNSVSGLEGRFGQLTTEAETGRADMQEAETQEQDHLQHAQNAIDEADKFSKSADGHEKEAARLDGEIAKLEGTKAGKKPEEIADIDKQIAPLRAAKEKELKAAEEDRQHQLEKIIEAWDHMNHANTAGEKKGTLDEKVKNLEKEIEELKKTIEELKQKQSQGQGGADGAGDQNKPKPFTPPQIPIPPITPPDGGPEVGEAIKYMEEAEAQIGTAYAARFLAEDAASRGDKEGAVSAAHKAREAADKALQNANNAQRIADQHKENQKLQQIANRAKEAARIADEQAKAAEDAAGLEHPEPKLNEPRISTEGANDPAFGLGGKDAPLSQNYSAWKDLMST